jgi:hypothetical protein
MATTSTMQEQPVIKRSLLKQRVALFLFLIVGGLFASPCLCLEGEAASNYKMAFLFLVLCRLAWQVYKRTFRWRDYFIYFALVIGFCIWADYQF